MPNYIRNIINFDCSEERLKEILEHIQNDEAGIGSIDFNKLIPMPESLNMTSGSIESDTICLYLTSINPDVSYLGTEKVSSDRFLEINNEVKAIQKYHEYNIKMTEVKIKDTVNGVMKWPEYEGESFEEVQSSLVEMGKQYLNNVLEYGSTTWYDWRISQWNTKWAGFDFDEYEGGNTIAFSTAWSPPTPIIEKLSELYPEVIINHQWADEDLGYNVGEAEYNENEQVSLYIPTGGSREAYEMAASIQGFDLAEYGYQLSDDGSTYEYVEENDIEMKGM
jgi:hypothetical protein